MRKVSLFFLPFFLLVISCKSNSKYSDKNNVFVAKEILKIEFQKPHNTRCKSDFKEFSINDPDIINQFISDINNASIDGAWKGACWNRICFISKDTTYTLSTNDDVFGDGASGIFYQLPEKGGIEKLRESTHK